MERHLHPVLLFPLFVLLMVLEGFWLAARHDKRYPWREGLASFVVYLGEQLSNLVSLLIVWPIFHWVYAHRVSTLTLTGARDYLGFFLAVEFLYYWFHRFSHGIRWLWATHNVHHSAVNLNLSAAYRLGWTSWLSGAWLFWLPLAWAGYSPAAIGMALSLNLLYQLWLHTEVVPKLGFLEYLFNTPSRHRVHHASNPGYLDKNYGGTLIVFDRLFGTLAEEREPCTYGLAGKEPTDNPFRIALREWIDMARDVRKTGSWSARLRLLFGPPR